MEEQHIRSWIHKLTDRFAIWIAWRLPRRVVLWAAIRLIAHATQDEYSNQEVPELQALEALERWDV